jgi:hypothetical protein
MKLCSEAKLKTMKVLLIAVLVAAVCVLPQVDAMCPVIADYNLNPVPTLSATLVQKFQDQLSAVDFVINLCKPVNLPFGNSTACSEAGFLSEYNNNACGIVWNALTGGQTNQSAVMLSYVSTIGHTASVKLTCGSTLALVSAGDVVATYLSNGKFNFAFSFQTSAACSVPPSPPPPPTPPQPPVLPQAFFGNFTEFNAFQDTVGPPYVNGLPPAPFVATRGVVYYDWSQKAMIEHRYDYCVNIFPTGNNFPCTFHNINGVSYLITYNETSAFPPCCVFGSPWFPPEPSFLRSNVTSVFEGVAPWSMSEANWFEIPSIQPPTGPFFYSFNSSIPSNVPQTYLSFSFPGMEGWVQQNFFNIRQEKPPASVWELPEICLPVASLPNCEFFGSSSSSSN